MVMYDDSYKKTQGLKFAVAEKQFQPQAEPQIHTVMHYHSDMELLFIDEGVAQFQIAGKTWIAEKGDLVIVNPYEAHSGETVGEKLKFRCIDFDVTLLALPDNDSLLQGTEKYESLVKNAVGIQRLFSSCFDAVLMRENGWELKARGCLLLMFSQLTEKIHSSVLTKDQAFARQMIDYLEEHYREDLTSAEPAEAFYYNQSYFCRKFKRLFSQSFGDYLNAFRVSKAKEVLKTHGVSKTAVLCGFQNISYFSRVFKSVTGETPTEYKRVNYELRKDK